MPMHIVALASTVLFGICATVTAVYMQPSASQTVHVTAERFMFTPSEISVPVGTEIEFRLTSQDTAHGFRILGQPVELAIPKRGRGEATVRFAPPGPGSYVFECSRMCGAGHGFMRGTITVKAEKTRGLR